MIRLRLLAYALVILGVAMDQISTRIILQRPDIYETNPFAVTVMSLGLWLPLDLLLLVASIALPEIILRRWTFPGRLGILAYPAVFGAVRLGAGIWNLHWLL